MSIELRALAILALVAGLLLGYAAWAHKIRAEGAAEVQTKWNAAVQIQQSQAIELEAHYRAEEKAAQDAINAKDATYAAQIQAIKRNDAARKPAVDGMRNRLDAVASAASQAAGAANDTCRLADERLARGARLLSEGVGLVAEGRSLVERLDAKVTALQPSAPKESSP